MAGRRVRLGIRSEPRRAAARGALERAGWQLGDPADVLLTDVLVESELAVLWWPEEPPAEAPLWVELHLGTAEGLPLRALRACRRRAALSDLQVERAAGERARRIVAHDLRTPIANLVGQLDLLESGLRGELSDTQRRAVRLLTRNTERVWALADEVRDALQSARDRTGRPGSGPDGDEPPSS